MSVYRLAKQSGLTQQAIHNVERRLRSSTVATLVRMAHGLNVDLWRLVKRAEVRSFDAD